MLIVKQNNIVFQLTFNSSMGGDTARATDQRWRVAAARAGGSEDDGSERPSDSEVGGEGSAGEGDGNEGGCGGISSGEGDGSHSCVLRTHSVETVNGWQHVHGQECPRSGSSSVLVWRTFTTRKCVPGK